MSVKVNDLVTDDKFKKDLNARALRGKVWGWFFFSANVVALGMLIILVMHVLNQSFGLVAVRNTIDPETLSEKPLDDLSEPELATIMIDNLGNRVKVFIRDNLSKVPQTDFTTRPLSEVLAGSTVPDGRDDATINDLTDEELAFILTADFSHKELHNAVIQQIVQPRVEKSWRLLDSIINRGSIEAEMAEKFPDDKLQFRNWLNLDFILSKSSSSATTTGLQTALIGSAWVIFLTIITALPLGVGASIYMEEYAADNFVNRLIETNLRNLAAVPSIIYGMLGLAVFVRIMEPLTSGRIFGVEGMNGRSIMSAAFTLALLILPVIIVNAREAIRAVPSSIRDASYGLGATKWQTIQRQVLPAAMPGILTGVILSMSRAVGETAPLLVVGATTFIGRNPGGPFDKFTVMPIQIFQWTSEAIAEFKYVAAAAIIVLLVLMVTLNAVAILLRNRYAKRY